MDADSSEEAIGNPVPVEEWARIGGALVVVLAAIFLLRFVMRRLAGPLAGHGRPSGVVEVLARYPLARGQSVVLMRVARRVLILHQSSGSLSTLSEEPEAEKKRAANMPGPKRVAATSIAVDV